MYASAANLVISCTSIVLLLQVWWQVGSLQNVMRQTVGKVHNGTSVIILLCCLKTNHPAFCRLSKVTVDDAKIASQGTRKPRLWIVYGALLHSISTPLLSTRSYESLADTRSQPGSVDHISPLLVANATLLTTCQGVHDSKTRLAKTILIGPCSSCSR